MKKLLILFLLVSFSVFSQTYKAITPNDTVKTKEEVVVEVATTVIDKDSITLDRLDAKIIGIQNEISTLQEELDECLAQRPKVDTEASKVKLYVEPEPELIE